jgi:hypothetical protein
LYNTNDNYDSGLFDLLKIKLVQANMTLNNFMVTFTTEGQYVFADSSNPQIQSIIVKVSSSVCPATGSNIYPITAENLKKF